MRCAPPRFGETTWPVWGSRSTNGPATRLRRPAHHRDRERAAAPGRQVHPLRWWHEPPAPVPGFELTATHSDAWSLGEVPPSMLVVGGGATGVQIASVFNAFGSRVQLLEAGPRILATEDEDVSAAVAEAFRASGVEVREGFGTIDRFEATPSGVRMVFSKEGAIDSVEAIARRHRRRLGGRHRRNEPRGRRRRCTDRARLRVGRLLAADLCAARFAAGDITGRLMLVPQAIHDGYVAATNAVSDTAMTLADQVRSPSAASPTRSTPRSE